MERGSSYLLSSKIFLDTSTTIFYPVFTKVVWYYWFAINTVNRLFKSFHFQQLMVWEYLEIGFLIQVKGFSLLDYYFFLFFLSFFSFSLASAMKKSVYIFDKDLMFTRNMVCFLKRSKFVKAPTQTEFIVFTEILHICYL